MMRIDCQGVAAEAAAASEEIGAAIACFVKHGYVILDHVVPAETIHALHHEFERDYGGLLKREEDEMSKEVGDARFMIPLRFAKGFADAAIFANPYVIPVVRGVLEPTAILEAYGAVVSFPGAKAQPNHQDGPHLFGAEISALLPSHALTFALPLVDMNEVQGTTTLLPGSHRWRRAGEDVEGISPTIPAGSCMMWDFRLVHSGTANLSSVQRPMLYCTYSRPWYRDPVNFRGKKMPRVDFDAGFLDSLPEDTRLLLNHAA